MKVTLVLICAALLTVPLAADAASSATFQGRGGDRLDACKTAKDTARLRFDGRSPTDKALAMERRIQLSECDCEQESASYWVCNVEASVPEAKGTSTYSSPPRQAATEVRTVDAKGNTEQEACSNAKYIGERSVSPGAKVIGFSNCVCGPISGSTFRYSCSTDVNYQRP